MIWLKSLGLSLLLTLVIELTAALILRKRDRALAVVALVNLLTNPPAVFITLLASYRRWTNLGLWMLCTEAAVFVTEALIYRRFGEDFKHPWLFSLLLNGVSFGLGVAFQSLLSSLSNGGIP